MHDASPAGQALAARTLAYWRNVDATLERAQAAQNRTRAYLLTRAIVRALACLTAALTGIASVYVLAFCFLVIGA